MPREKPIEIFSPPNMLKAKVGGVGGGAVDMAALKRAESALGGLKNEFGNWMQDDMDRLRTARDFFASMRNDSSSASLHRISQDVKSQAQTFGFPFASRIALSLCKLLESLKNAAPIELIDAHVDAIRIIVVKKISNTTDKATCLVAETLEQRVGELVRV